MEKTITLLLLIGFITYSKAADNDGSYGKKQVCQPFSCTWKWSNDSCTRYWVYDDWGRLITDSVYSSDSLRMPHYADHYVYPQDSMILLSAYGGQTVIKAKAGGLPISCDMPYGVKYRAYYKADGNLEKVISTVPFINEKGLPDITTTITDSIIYVNGNIIAYRISSTSSTLRNTFTFSYYTDKLYHPEYNQGYRQQALSFSNGNLNAQAFGRNLVKTMHCAYTDESFEYILGEDGRIVEMDNKTIGHYGQQSYTTEAHSSYKYICN